MELKRSRISSAHRSIPDSAQIKLFHGDVELDDKSVTIYIASDGSIAVEIILNNLPEIQSRIRYIN